MSESGRQAAIEKMQAAGVHEAAIGAFAHAYEQLEAGEQGLLREAELEQVGDLPDAQELVDASDAQLDRVVVLKLNGGLGTSMGMTGPKGLLEVKDGSSFLDLTVRQVRTLREATGAQVPLVLMNSFATREATRAALGDAAEDFLQNKVPKLRADDLAPVEWPEDPDKEWAPPGHGDLYAALVGSGMLDSLLARGLRWAFVSNVDNLGATLDPRILAWIAREEIPFVMEVADRTEADKKGGHIARRRDGGGFVLRETAQTADEDLAAFQDVARHRFFNTNNLWIDLEALRALLDATGGVMRLPMIVNRKTVDPSKASSTPVIQLETAMGAAIDVFDGAQAIRVPRRRFAPVKTTDDLLVVRSDAWTMRPDGLVEPASDPLPVVELDPQHYKLLHDFESHFPVGAPSLVECRRLVVRGPVTFGARIVVRGEVELDKDVDKVLDGTLLEGGAGKSAVDPGSHAGITTPAGPAVGEGEPVPGDAL